MKVRIGEIIVILSIVINVNTIKFKRSQSGYKAFPCGTEDIVSQFKKLEDGYDVTIKKALSAATDVRLVFDSEAAVFVKNDVGRHSRAHDNIYNIFNLLVIKDTDQFKFNVKGQLPPYSPPYLTSLKINEEEYCRNHNVTYFEAFPVGITKISGVPNRYCGKRKVLQTGLIQSGYSTKAGDWPWHAALYHQDKGDLKYVCGGTLISKFTVLTAAHCTTIHGVAVLPDVMGVVLGKYFLHGSDASAQERQVFQVIVHDEYSSKTLKNDISLLKLRTEAEFNNYIQPACLWYEEIYDKLTSFEIQGTVVGWGFDSSDTLSPTLLAANLPIISHWTCISSNTVFYANALQDQKRFCAGYKNGTSPCNGDSGGGFTVFVPDLPSSTGTKVPGAWYVRGIVSSSISRDEQSTLCNPYAYALFTDVSKYLTWIKENMT